MYRLPFLVTERLSCPFVVGIQLLNQHMEAFWCTHGLVQFTWSDLHIIGKGTTENDWTDVKGAQAQLERALRTKYGHGEAGDESSILTIIRFCRMIILPAYIKIKVSVRCHLGGVIHTEPKKGIQERYGT